MTPYGARLSWTRPIIGARFTHPLSEEQKFCFESVFQVIKPNTYIYLLLQTFINSHRLRPKKRDWGRNSPLVKGLQFC